MLKYDTYGIVYRELPGEVALSFSITNCPHLCKGCHSPHLRKNIGTDIKEIYPIIDKYKRHITAICFLGHGAEDHIEEFTEELKNIKEKYPEIVLGVYSGFDYMFPEIKEQVKYYKVGRYIAALGGLDSPTTNQILHKLT